MLNGSATDKKNVRDAIKHLFVHFVRSCSHFSSMSVSSATLNIYFFRTHKIDAIPECQ